MRFANTVIIAAILIPICATADIRLGSGVFDISELAEAQAEASEKGKPITFLYTNKKSDCPLCDGAGRMILDELDRDTVVVYVESLEKAPAVVKSYLAAEGSYIPKAAVFDADVTKPLGRVIFEAINKNGKKAFDEVQDAIKTSVKQASEARKVLVVGGRFEREKKLGQAWDSYEQASKLGNAQATKDVERLEKARDEAIAAARKMRKEGKYYASVLTLSKVVSAYGESHAGEASKEMGEMKADPKISDEVSAELIYRKAKAKKDKGMLQQILDKYPNTTAADNARKVLKQ